MKRQSYKVIIKDPFEEVKEPISWKNIFRMGVQRIEYDERDGEEYLYGYRIYVELIDSNKTCVCPLEFGTPKEAFDYITKVYNKIENGTKLIDFNEER